MTSGEINPQALTGAATSGRLLQHCLAGVVPLLAGLVLAIYSWSLPLGSLSNPGPGLWLFVCSLVLVVSSMAILWADRPRGDYETYTKGVRRVALGTASLCVYVALFYSFGFILPSFLLLVFWLRVLGGESWILTLSVTLASITGFYMLFDQALQIPFPQGALVSIAGLWS